MARGNAERAGPATRESAPGRARALRFCLRHAEERVGAAILAPSRKPTTRLPSDASSSAISTRSWRALRLLILWNALTMRTEPGGLQESEHAFVAARRAGLALPSSSPPVPPPKKNEIGTSRASEMRCSRPAPMRFTPFSYFCTCWKVTPIRSANSVCDRPALQPPRTDTTADFRIAEVGSSGSHVFIESLWPVS